jgi:hypothetical protein
MASTVPGDNAAELRNRTPVTRTDFQWRWVWPVLSSSLNSFSRKPRRTNSLERLESPRQGETLQWRTRWGRDVTFTDVENLANLVGNAGDCGVRSGVMMIARLS